ncbi:MAG TPA: PHP domain-containing protein [Anaerolineales bacterium]
MLRVEFHCHTRYSKDSMLEPKRLVECCMRKGIDRVVVTDHNSIAGALAARQLDAQRVIIGEEIMTTRGEILAAFVEVEIPPGLSPQETIWRLRQQDAFISVSHPFDTDRKGGWNERDLLDILPFVDAIEVFNSRCMWPAQNRRASDFGQRHGLAGTVGSDAHTCWELGRATLELESFRTVEDLRAVIRSGRARTQWSPPWIHLASRYAVLRKRMGSNLDTA